MEDVNGKYWSEELRNQGGRPKKVVHERKVEGNAILNSLALAQLLGCSDSQAMKLLRDGEIAGKKAGNGWLTTINAVVRYLEAQK